MNTYDALAYAIEVLASINIHQYPDGDDAADALTRLHDALPNALGLLKDYASTLEEIGADDDFLTRTIRALDA